MPRQTTYTDARANLASLCDEVAESAEPVYITRRGAPAVALISAAELRSLEETAHLMRSPKNAARLRSALAEAKRGGGVRMTVAELRSRFGLEEEG